MDIFKEEGHYTLIELAQISKSYIGNIADSITSGVFDGYDDALSVYIKAKALSELADKIIDGVKEDAISQVELYGTGGKIMGCDVQIKSMSNQYSFDHDDEWCAIDDEMKRLAKLKKEREQKMIDATKYAELADENGEIIPPAIVKKYGGTTIAIVIPK